VIDLILPPGAAALFDAALLLQALDMREHST
jgi:hypothetical protein